MNSSSLIIFDGSNEIICVRKNVYIVRSSNVTIFRVRANRVPSRVIKSVTYKLVNCSIGKKKTQKILKKKKKPLKR